MNTISSGSPAPAVTAPIKSLSGTQPTNKDTPAATVFDDTSVEKVKLQAPEKIDLGFDAKESKQNLQEAVERLNQQLKDTGRDLSFRVDEELKRPIITVHNLKTGEVVRQIPNEEVIRMAHSIEAGKGLLFNESM